MKNSHKLIRNYYPEIDFIKAFAIISVVILHILSSSGSKTILYNILAPYHIWQAVPLFMLIFGFTFRLSIEKNHNIVKILSTRTIRLIIPLLVVYVVSFLQIFIFDLHPVIDWHIFIGLLPTTGMGNYFITLYIETTIYFTIFYYIVKHFNKYFVILFSILISVVGELIAFSIDVKDLYMYSPSVHRYTLLIALGYYFYDDINSKKNKSLLILGGVSALLIYMFSISHHPFWPYSEYSSAVLWGFQHFPYEFYTVIFALILMHLYKKINYKFFEKTVFIIGRSSFHIFLVQIFVFSTERLFKIHMNITYAFLTLFISVLLGIAWHKIEDLTLKWAVRNVG